MKNFLAFFAALVLGQCCATGDHKSAAIKESVVAHAEADYGEAKIVKPKTIFRYPEGDLIDDGSVFVEDLAELGDERKMYFQQLKLQRKLSHNQRRRAKKVPFPSTVACAPIVKGSKKSYFTPTPAGCVPVAAPVVQPVYIAPLAPVAQPVAAPVTVPFYVPVTQPNSPPVGAPVAVTISLNSNTVPVATPVSTPVATPVSTPGTSAPAVVQSSSSAPVSSAIGGSTAPVVTSGGSTAPVVTSGGSTAPVVPIYVQATALDCQAIVSGTGLVQGQNGMDSKTFTFVFSLNSVTATNLASVVATAKAALQALVAQKVVRCGSQGKGKGSKRWRERRKLQNKSRGRGLQWHSRHLLEANIVGNVNWDLDCVEIVPCFPPGTCFSCTVTAEVFLKGPATQEDVVKEFRDLIESPTFLKDSGLDGFSNDFQPDFTIGSTATTSVGNETGKIELGDVPAIETGDVPGDELGDVPGDELGDVPGDELGDTPPNNAGSRGDPHFKSWRGEHFEFHGQCDLVLARDPKFAGLGLDVQIRTKLVRYWSYIKSAAVRIGDDIVEVEGSVDTDNQLSNYWINFELQGKQRTIGGFPLNYFDDRARPYPKRRFEIDLGSKYPGQKIVIAMFKEFVKVDFANASMEAYGNTVGILGDYKSGLTYGRDKTTVIQDFNDLGLEWQVRPDDDMMLFHDVEVPQFPKKCLLPEDPRGERRRRLESSSISAEEAEVACASLKDPMDIKDCVYDILATQDLDMVGAF